MPEIGTTNLLYFGVAVVVILLVFMLLNLVSRRNRTVDDRIQRVVHSRSLGSQSDIGPTTATPGLEKVQDLISKAQMFSGALMPKTELEQNTLKLRLANAGFRNEKALSIYIGIKTITLIALAVIPGIALAMWKLFPFDY